MNEDEARLVRLYQYLLSKEVSLQQTIQDIEKLLRRRNPLPEDVFAFFVALLRLEIWQEFSGEVWNLIK